MNNALENAIEASSKVEGGKRISLRSYMKGNLFFIEVENDFSGEIIFDSETGLPASSKEDRKLHGLGIGNIQRCMVYKFCIKIILFIFCFQAFFI